VTESNNTSNTAVPLELTGYTLSLSLSLSLFSLLSPSPLRQQPPTTATNRSLVARMATAASSMPASVPKADIESFQAHLAKSTKVLALLGAGLSASSGLPTFRGAGGLWRTHTATVLATPEAFEENPGLVWQFYSYRRHMALKAQPNPAHYALAELAKKMGDGFQTLSQNVDGTYGPHSRIIKTR
jgi:hypothetical protein